MCNVIYIASKEEPFEPLDFNDDRDERMTEKDRKSRGQKILDMKNRRRRPNMLWKIEITEMM